MSKSSIYDVLTAQKDSILMNWENEQKKSIRSDLVRPTELKAQLKEFIELFTHASKNGSFKDMDTKEWKPVTEFLTSLSYSRGAQGFTPTETALFVFSLKKTMIDTLQTSSPAEIWEFNDFLDKLGLYTTEIYQKAREEIINRQQSDMLELSTPVVELSEGIIALPMIGTLDSSRTSVVMETLLQRIVETSASIAIIDITGVPTVDTLVAQHLLKTVTAAKLMGAECIISGIRPQIAATIVHLGVDLGNVITKASLASAFQLALRKTGHSIVKSAPKA